MTPAMRIVYRIVDEYGTRLRFKLGQSTQPLLSMGELIALTDGATGGEEIQCRAASDHAAGG
jgi:hypothetical protein